MFLQRLASFFLFYSFFFFSFYSLADSLQVTSNQETLQSSQYLQDLSKESIKKNNMIFQVEPQISSKVHNLLIGNSIVEVHEFHLKNLTPSNSSILNLVHLHQNELTSLKAGMSIITKYGGQIITIKHGEGSTRNINFSIDDKFYQFDPNRMFTDSGISQTLKDHNTYYSDEAFIQIKNFANKFLSLIQKDMNEDTRKLRYNNIVALHNNFNMSYSIKSYVAKGNLEKESEEVFIVNNQDHDDFFFTTSPNLFNYLKNEKSFSAVLQNKNATDDGSLSLYYARNMSVPYVNVEAQHDHYDQQLKMLEFLQKYFSSNNNSLN